MGLYVPTGADFKWQLSSNGTTRPAAAYGASVTPGTNVMGSWVQLFSAAQVVNDVYGLLINVNSAATAAAIRNVLMDLGVDNAGGTAYLTKIPYLLVGGASPYNVGAGGVWYYFPLFIPKGSSIAVRAQGTVTTAIRAFVQIYGQPRRPDSVRVGTKVYSFGESTASSQGTSVTFGTTSKGAWTQVGAATSMRLWWWQVGYAAVDTTMSLTSLHIDVGAGTTTANTKFLIQDTLITTSSSEQINNLPLTAGCTATVAPGQNIYVRGQGSAAQDTGANVIAYGLGG